MLESRIIVCVHRLTLTDHLARRRAGSSSGDQTALTPCQITKLSVAAITQVKPGTATVNQPEGLFPELLSTLLPASSPQRKYFLQSPNFSCSFFFHRFDIQPQTYKLFQVQVLMSRI